MTIKILNTMHVADVEGMNWTAITGECDGKPFMCVVGMETDDRDMEFNHIYGPNLSWEQGDGTGWDALLVAMSGKDGW